MGRDLRIAAVTTAAESFVPPLMQAFARVRPDIGLRLEVGNRDRVLAMVLGHDADVAVGGNPPRDGRIEAHAIRPNEPVLIAAADDPLAGAGAVDADALAGRTWLLRDTGSGTGALANESFLAEAGIEAEMLTP